MKVIIRTLLTVFLLLGTAQLALAKNILVLGDSLSAEYGIARHTGWVQLIAQNHLKHYPDYTMINASISGDTSASGLQRLAPLLAQHQPTIVIIELGANDALRGLSLKQMESNFRQMQAAIHQTSAQVLWVGMQIPPNYGPTYTEGFKRLFSQLKAPQDQLVPFLLEGFALDQTKFQDDGLHPNESAQSIMADNVWSLLVTMLSPTQ